jgi:L,D-peptidoglycan transpeptidase YkuD (ErfK/YbiS/YcfS/YnhG family)
MKNPVFQIVVHPKTDIPLEQLKTQDHHLLSLEAALCRCVVSYVAIALTLLSSPMHVHLILACMTSLGALANVSWFQEIPKSTKQMLLVHSTSWRATSGYLLRFQRSTESWRGEGSPIPVSLGERGLAWGRGLQRNQEPGPIKLEGDKRTPAGIFTLGPAFGYCTIKPPEVTLPYLTASDNSYYVDDPDSQFYNQWVDLKSGEPLQWKSAENMRRQDRQYYLGVVVQQNVHPIVKGRGSAVFLHIRPRPDQVTTGCIAMSESNLRKILMWLKPDQDPILVVIPDKDVTILEWR